MTTSHTSHTKSLRLTLLACACVVSAGLCARGQSVSRSDAFSGEAARGVEFYRQANYEEAVKAFKKATKEKKDDPDVWRFLGLTYEKQGKTRDALKAWERAAILSLAKLAPKPVSGEDYSKLSREERAARRLRFSTDCRLAAEIVEDYLRLRPQTAEFWRTQLDALRFYAEESVNISDRASVFSGQDVETKARILSRPEPLYTEEARSKRVSGQVSLRLVLAADGTAQHILALGFLPHGLTDQAIAAARAVKFIPATKDGRAVSQFVTIMYTFETY